MKFNWGHGILAVLILFLLASAGIILFAFSQDVNLVHKDYYEKGVAYSEQIRVNARSAAYHDSVAVEESPEYYMIRFSNNLALQMDSGMVLFYYPPDSKKDRIILLSEHDNLITVKKTDLQKGRYEIKINWYMMGLKYEANKTILIK